MGGHSRSYSICKKKINVEAEKDSLIGVMGAFVFAMQIVNFFIPGTVSSGHIA